MYPTLIVVLVCLQRGFVQWMVVVGRVRGRAGERVYDSDPAPDLELCRPGLSREPTRSSLMGRKISLNGASAPPWMNSTTDSARLARTTLLLVRVRMSTAIRTVLLHDFVI